MKIWLNGALRDAETPALRTDDRGLLLGDGLFETLAVRNGRPVFLAEHWRRLAESARELAIPLPFEAETLRSAIADLAAANGLSEASVRITLTRGPGPRGLSPPADPEPTLFITAAPLGPPPLSWSAVTVSIRRNESSPLSRLKSLNYGDMILARREANAAGADEAILLNGQGGLCCASIANLFLWFGSELVTAAPSDGVLPGIARAKLLTLAAARGIEIHESAPALDEMRRASGAFLSNSLMGVVPLTRIDAIEFPVPAATLDLQDALRELEREDVR